MLLGKQPLQLVSRTAVDDTVIAYWRQEREERKAIAPKSAP